MRRARTVMAVLAALLWGAGKSQAAAIEFSPKELFRVPFGNDRNTLGARIEGSNFLIPRDFTMDAAGHFYIYDSNHHRIARFSSGGAYEMGIAYPATARQVFAHADAHENLWLLISDPTRGLYYGVYDTRGKRLREGIFAQFNTFRLHVDDDYTLHVIVSSDKNPKTVQTYFFDQESLLMKKETVAPPPEDHHQVHRAGRIYFIDPVPGAGKDSSHHVVQVTDVEHRTVGSLRGDVVYVTDDGEVYTRVGEREIDVYDVKGSLKGKVILEGLAAACAAVRFDSAGNIYELDGIPDKDRQYSPSMPGMRLIFWERR
jgi:hypothetical protein